MTTEMIIALVIFVGMVIMIMSDKFAFGAPPLIACALLVLTGISAPEEAFAGFVDKNVIMVAGFMVVMAGFQKTSLIAKIKSTLYNMANKGGKKGYILMLLIVMLGASFIGGTGYYVMILSIISTIPYSKNMPSGKIFMPLAYGTYNSLIPFNMAMMAGIMASVLGSTGFEGANIPMLNLSIMTFIRSMIFLVWAIIAYRFLPDRPIGEAESTEETKKEEAGPSLSKWQESVVYVLMIVTIGCMVMLNSLGDRGYAVPAVAASVMLVLGIINFKEVLGNIASPVIIMMASVIGVAGALANTGFTGMIGEMAAGLLGGMSPFVIVLAFAMLTSISATFTGASFGSLFVFAPIAVAACMSMGLNPTAVAVACTSAAWINWFMPIDGMPALVMGMGKYKLGEFWLFTIPLWILQMVTLAVTATNIFPL